MARSPIKSINETDDTASVEETVDFDEDTLKAIAEVYKNEGNDKYGKKDFSKAVHFYTEGIKVNCKDDELNSKLYSNRASAHFYLGNSTDSLNDARAATKLRPDYLKAIVRGASACVELKQFEEAITWCDKGLAIDKTNRNLLALKTKAIKEQELQESIDEEGKDHSETQSEKDTHAAVRRISKLPSSVAESPIEITRERDVASIVGETLEIDEDTLRAKAEAYKNEGNDEYRKRDFSKAIDFYTEGIKLNCKDEELNTKLYSNRAIAHFYMGNYQDSLNDAKAATKLRPDYLKVIVRGASACVELKQFEEAITWCDKGLAIDKKNQNLLELRTKAIERQKLQESSNEEGKDLSETQSEKESHAEVKKISKLPASMGRSPIKVADESDVTPPAEETLEFDDDTLRAIAQVYLNEGNDQHRKKDFFNAIHFYTEGIEVNCTDEVLKAKLFSNRATAYFYMGNYLDSLRDVRSATDLRPDCVKAIVRGASACMKLDQFEEAITWCDKGLAFDKRNAGLLELRIKAIKEQNTLHRSRRDKGKEHSGTRKDMVNSSLHQEEGKGEAIPLEGLRSAFLGTLFSSRGEFQKAIEYHSQYLAITKELGDRKEEGIAYCNLGIAYYKLGNFKKAIHYHNQHLRIAKEVGDEVQEGSAYNNLGLAFCGLGDFKTAEEYHEKDLTIANEIGDKSAKGRAYGNLGNVFYGFGDFRKGIEYHKLRLSIVKELGNKAWEGDAYGDLGIGFFHLGDFKKVVQYYKRHLSISRAVGDKDMEGRACANLGNAFYHLGDLRNCIEYYNMHLDIGRSLGNKYEEGRAYCNLGNAFDKMGDFKKAIDNFRLSLSTAEYAGNKALKGLLYCNLGNAFFSLGDYKKAKEYHYVDLAISKDIGDRAGEGRACGNLGNDFYHLGDFKKAVKYNELHLSIAKEVGDRTGEGRAYDNLGTAYQRLGAFDKALEHHNLALGIAKEVGEKAAEGRAYANLGNALLSLGEFQKAITYYDRFLLIAKDVGDKKLEGEAHYALGNSYESLDNLSEALEYYQSSVRLFNDVRSLLRSKDEWKIGFRNEHQLAYNGLWRILIKEDRTTEALFASEEGRAQALADLMESQYGLPASGSRSHVLPMKDYDILKCIPSSTVFQALDRSTITHWVLVEGRVVGFKQNEIEGDATTLFRSLIQNAYNSIGVRAGVSCEDRSMDALRKPTSPDEKSDEEVTPPSPLQGSSLNTLYDIVIKPMTDLIKGNELIIVPDGPLWLAPYAAFVDSNSKYLCESFQIRLIPSLTSLKMINDCPEGYHCKSGALLVGDPWVAEVTDSEGNKLLEQLAFAKLEVEMIGKILKVTPVIGKEATKAAVLNRLSSVSLVHIAAHGRMETGEIALTPDPKRASRIPKKEDYVLTIEDVLSVKLRTKLVVLSCCHSGRGEIKAEGVVGIARAFIGAGARSVLVTLWAIDDEATLEFMRSFYHHLVKGKRASESLNQAMKDLRESDKYSDVKYWAPFVLIGDDVTLEFGAKK